MKMLRLEQGAWGQSLGPLHLWAMQRPGTGGLGLGTEGLGPGDWGPGA